MCATCTVSQGKLWLKLSKHWLYQYSPTLPFCGSTTGPWEDALNEARRQVLLATPEADRSNTDAMFYHLDDSVTSRSQRLCRIGVVVSILSLARTCWHFLRFWGNLVVSELSKYSMGRKRDPTEVLPRGPGRKAKKQGPPQLNVVKNGKPKGKGRFTNTMCSV